MSALDKIIKGGLGTIKAARRAELTPSDKALPLVLPRARLSPDFIDQQADRVARQMIGEHVTSGKPKDTKNLAGRSMKESERVKKLDYKLSPVGTVAKEVQYTPRKGDVTVAFPGDQTVSNKLLEEVNGLPIDSVQEGGAYYGLGQKHLPEPEFWKSTVGPAKNVQGKVDRVSELFEPERIIGSHLAMGPVSNNFAMHFADANLRAIDWQNVNQKKLNVFDNIIAGGYKDSITGERVRFPNWPGIANPEAALAAMKTDTTLRKWFNNRMKTPTLTQPLGLPNGLDIQYAITEPRLRDMEINMTGLMTGKLKPGAQVEAAGTPHNTYSHRILGEAEGPQEVLTPFVVGFPDAAQHIATTQRPSDFTGAIQKVFPHQLVDDQYIDDVNRYRDRIKKLTGQKDGGVVEASEEGGSVDDFDARVGKLIDQHHFDNRLNDMIDQHMAGGGIVKGVKAGVKMLFNDNVLPAPEAAANLQKFLEPSKAPMRLYHGTTATEGGKGVEAIRRLKPSKDGALGSGTYLTPSTANASGYSGSPNDEAIAAMLRSDYQADTGQQFLRNRQAGNVLPGQEGGNMLPVYAQIKNPLIIDGSHGDPMVEALTKLGMDEDKALRMVEKAYEDKGYIGKQVESRARAAGYDGLMQYRDGELSEVVSYNPNAVKSATGNEGTYDIYNPDLSKADGGRIAKGVIGALTKAKEMAKASKGTQDVLPAAERDANLAKFLEPSKVKDRLYHGTRAREKNGEALRTLSDENAPYRGGLKTFLTTNPKFASSYAEGEGANVLPVHAQIKNPFDFRDKFSGSEARYFWQDNGGIDSFDADKIKDGLGLKPSSELTEQQFVRAVEKGHWPALEAPEFADWLRGQGYDAIVTKEGGSINYGVYDSNKIKSAIGNQGTYDISQPDLSKAHGGYVNQDAMQMAVMNKRVQHKQFGGISKAGKVSKLMADILKSEGRYGASRLERAADEIPNLEKMYQREALMRAFSGDNAKALMTMNPEGFERYAAKLDVKNAPLKALGKNEVPTKWNSSTEDYVRSLSGLPKGFNDVPFLMIDKAEQGLPLVPYIAGHEGRHRNRALAEKGVQSGLIQLLPRSELREGFPRRSQQEYIEALKKELEMTGNRVTPEGYSDEIGRQSILLPDIYADGGAVHMKDGGTAPRDFKPAETPEQEIMRYLRMLRVNAAGGVSQGGASVGGRLGVDIPVSENVSIEPYVQGFAGFGKPQGGGGANIKFRFADGGVASGTNADILDVIAQSKAQTRPSTAALLQYGNMPPENQFERDFRARLVKEQAARENAVKRGFGTWVPEIPGFLGDLAVDLPYNIAQRAAGRRGDSIKPLGFGEDVRRVVGQTMGTAPDPLGETGMSAPPDKINEAVTDLLEMANPFNLAKVGSPFFALGAAASGAKQIGKGAVSGAKALTPTAAKLFEDYMMNTGMMLPVVKNKGGNFLPEGTKALDQLKSRGPTEFDREWLIRHADQDPIASERGLQAIPQNEAINQFIDKQLTRYVKNEMGTPEDPIRALAERGTLHFDAPTVAPGNFLDIKRQEFAAGNNEKWGYGESQLAQNWEDASDKIINKLSAGDYLKQKQIRKEFLLHTPDEPGMEFLNKVSPDTPLYGINNSPLPGFSRNDPSISTLGFPHLIDELRNATNPASGLPRELMLKPEALARLSVPQAVERVAKINEWRTGNIKQARLADAANTDVHKEYKDTGMRWVLLNKPGQFKAESDAMGHSVRGYEPTEGGGSSGYGLGGWDAIKSGDAKVYSLRDAKNEPHATIEVGVENPTPAFNKLSDEMQNELHDRAHKMHPEIEGGGWPPDFGDIGYEKTIYSLMQEPKYQQALRDAPPDIQKITQVKGKSNRAPNEEYLPYVQDFVKSGKWSSVGDPQNAGLRRYGDVFNVNEQRGIEATGEYVPDNEWLTGEDIQRLHNVITSEGKRLKYDARGNIIGGDPDSGMKHGGAVRMDARGNAIKLGKGGNVKKVIKSAGEYIDPVATKISDWEWRALQDVKKDVPITIVPDYVQAGYGQFMKDQAKKAAAGSLNDRDLMKAYLITQSSIGRGGLSHSTATKTGLKVPNAQEVRPEGAFATWLGSPAGQRYLDAAQKGEIDPKSLEDLRQKFAPFGKQNQLVDQMTNAVTTIPSMTPELNLAISGNANDYRDFAERLKGIAAAKSGFIGSLLGRGDLPTFDARQIGLHTSGMPMPTASVGPMLSRGKGLGGREAVDRLAARQKNMDLKIDPSLDPHYQHLTHHAIWDALGGEKTTHQDLIDAMKNYAKGGVVKMDAGGLLEKELEDARRPATVNPLMARKAEAIKQNAPAENMLTQYAETMPQNWQQFGQNMAQAYPTPATGGTRDQIMGAVMQAAINAGPGITKMVAPQEQALRLAQQRAALPVEQHGLGLPPNNTAAQRAAAMGFVENYVHSTNKPISKIEEGGKFSGIFTLPDRSANYGNVDMPLVVRGNIASDRDLRNLVKNSSRKEQRAINQELPKNPLDIADATVEMQKLRNELARKHGYSGVMHEDEFGDTVALVSPDNIRSRFAAFDPWRRNSALAAALGVAAPDLLAKEKKKRAGGLALTRTSLRQRKPNQLAR